jgi:hypothetical protein
MLNISQIKVPRLDWSARQQIEEFEAIAKESDEEEIKPKKAPLNLKRLTVVGMCHMGVDESPQSMDEGDTSPRTEINYMEMKAAAVGT